MKYVYEVSFRIRWDNDSSYPKHSETKTTVAGNAEEAIQKVKVSVSKDKYTDADTGKIHKVVGFKLSGVTEICAIDV